MSTEDELIFCYTVLGKFEIDLDTAKKMTDAGA